MYILSFAIYTNLVLLPTEITKGVAMKCECGEKFYCVVYHSVDNDVHATFFCRKGHTKSIVVDYKVFNKMDLPSDEYDIDLQV